MSPLLILLIETLGPLAINQVIAIYNSIANDPDTPEDVAEKAAMLVAEIMSINVELAASQLPGDEPEEE